MLINAKGKTVKFKPHARIPLNERAKLREVLEVSPPKRNGMFSLGERARLVS